MAKKPKALNVDDLSVADAELGEAAAGKIDPTPAGRTVIWTALGEERRAKSERGFHKEGEEVFTEHADHFISHKFATEGA